MNKHTDTPWYRKMCAITPDDDMTFIIATTNPRGLAVKSIEEREANAAYIVKAVNAHEELVKSLKEIRSKMLTLTAVSAKTNINTEHFKVAPRGKREILEAIDAALKLAGEEE